jgi:hypothetical protein
MLFPRNALTSGPQACVFAEKKNTKAKEGKIGKVLAADLVSW